MNIGGLNQYIEFITKSAFPPQTAMLYVKDNRGLIYEFRARVRDKPEYSFTFQPHVYVHRFNFKDSAIKNLHSYISACRLYDKFYRERLAVDLAYSYFKEIRIRESYISGMREIADMLYENDFDVPCDYMNGLVDCITPNRQPYKVAETENEYEIFTEPLYKYIRVCKKSCTRKQEKMINMSNFTMGVLESYMQNSEDSGIDIFSILRSLSTNTVFAKYISED